MGQAPTPRRRQAGDDIHLRSGPQMHEYQSIVARLARDSCGRVLDWGCGFGQVLDLLNKAGIEATGLLYRPDATAEGFAPVPQFPHLTAFHTREPVILPFEDAAFDTVLSCGVLEHVGDPDRSLDEIRRVLKPDGRFYVLKLPNRYSYLERIAKTAGMYYHGALPDDRVYTKRTALSLLESHGFRVIDFRRANMLPLTLDGAIATALTGAIWRANQALSLLPGINLVSTNLEIVAVPR